MAANESTYVLDVKLNDENEIFKFSYSTKWNDISLMLLLKYDCEEGYWFSFTDKDDMLKIIHNQDDFNEALKFCANNFDVLNVQMWSPNMSKEDLNKKKEQQPDTSVDGEISANGEPRSSQYLIVAGKAIGGIGNLASGVVKSATNYFSPATPSTSDDTVNEDPKPDIELEDMSPSTSSKPNLPETPNVDSPPPQVEPGTIKSQQHEEENEQEEKPESKCEEDFGEIADSIEDKKLEPSTTESELVERIKQEVQCAVRLELQAIREELTQLVVAKQQVGSASQARSFLVMKEDIKLLKKDLKLAKNMQGLIDSRLLSGSERRSNLDRDMTVGIVCENLPAQSRVDPGKEFEKCWVLKNDGDRPWCPGITLKMVDEEPDSRFESKKGRDLWRVFHPVPALECGGVTAISLIHTAPIYPCSYVTTWSLCVGSDLFGPLLRCHVDVGGEQQCCWPDERPELPPRIKRECFTGVADNETDNDEQEISRSCLSSFKLNDETSVISGTSATSVALVAEKDVVEDSSNVQQQAVITPSSSDLTTTNSETSKKSDNVVEDDGESSDFEVIPIPSCFDLTRPFKASETENSADNGDAATADSSVDTISENKEAIKMNEEEAGSSTSANDCGELVEAPPLPTLSDLSGSSSSISILNCSAPQSMLSTASVTQEDEVSSSTTPTPVAASSSSSTSTSTTVADSSDSGIDKLVKTKKIGIKERPIPVPRSVIDADKPFQQQQKEENAQPSTSSPARKLSKKINPSRPVDGKEVKGAKPAARPEGSRPAGTASKVKAKTPVKNRHAEKLKTLSEMGFSDHQLNKHLLDQFNGDITSVVHALVTHLTGDLNEGEDGLVAPGQLGSRSDSFMV